MLNLESADAMPAEVIALQGISQDISGISAIAKTSDGVEVDLLLVTDRQPFTFVEESVIEQFNTIAQIPVVSSGIMTLYAEPLAESGILETIEEGTVMKAQMRETSEEWLQVEMETSSGLLQTGWIQTAEVYVAGDITGLPVYDDLDTKVDENTLFLIVPFHPDDPANGGNIDIIIESATRTCNPLDLNINALPEAPGAFEQTVTLMGEMLAVQRAESGVSRDEMLAGELAELAPELVALAISQRLYDGPDNPQSLLAILAQIQDDSLSEEDVDLLDAIIGRVGLVDYLQTEMGDYESAYNTDDKTTINLFKSSVSNPELINYTSGQSQRDDTPGLNYRDITNGEDLAHEMSRATSALYRLTDGASGRVLNDLGAVATVGGLFTGEGTIPSLIFDVGGRMVYVEKARLERIAYSGPTVWQDLQVNITPSIILNENDTRDAEWTVTAVVATVPREITRLNAYDAVRFIPLSTPADDVLGVVDAISAVCGGNGSPCGEIPVYRTIAAHVWTIRDIDEPWLFEVRRPTLPRNPIYSYALPNPGNLIQASNRLTPVNAGRYPLLVTAPRNAFGLYTGDGFGDEDVIVSEIEIDYEPSDSLPDLILAPSETQNLCYTVSLEHALREDNRDDVAYEVWDGDGVIIANGELIRDQEFCFTVGPIEPATWAECELVSNYEHYNVELTALAENGSRGGENWHNESLAPDRMESFSIRVDAEEPDEPDECQHEGTWYLVPTEVIMACPTISTTVPFSGVPIALEAESLNAGTSVFGQLDQVLTMPGAELLPPELASDIAEADETIDNLQTTNLELDSSGTLFTSIPDIAREGATYIVVMPIDSSGEIPGDVLFTMTFTTDTTFEGDMLINMSLPSVGACEVTMDFTGYFEANVTP